MGIFNMIDTYTPTTGLRVVNILENGRKDDNNKPTYIWRWSTQQLWVSSTGKEEWRNLIYKK